MGWLWMVLLALAALLVWTWSSRGSWRAPPPGPGDTRAEAPATQLLPRPEHGADTRPMAEADEEAARAAAAARREADALLQREAERRAEQQARREAERLAGQQAAQARREAARLADEAALRAAYRAAEEAAQRRDADKRAAEVAAAAERRAAKAAADAERRNAEAAAEATRREAERRAARELAERQAREAALAAEAAQAAAEAARAAVPPRTPERTLVMVVDDSKVVRVKTSRLLARLNYRVALAEEGQDALRQIEAEAPQVLITDVEMPGVDGFELTRQVRGNPRTAQIPIIMITSSDERLRGAAADAGVTVLLGKPYSDEELLAHIERHAGVTASSTA